MKKLSLLLAFSLMAFTQTSFAQNWITFSPGIIVGTVSSQPTGYAAYIGGGILTEKVRVATSGTPFWADFVFEPTFKLRSLEELENFIKLNKHLPDVPSTGDVTQNGLDLAQTDALLLQKIEELTLYVIEQNKKIATLEEKVQKMSKNKKIK